VNVNRYEWTANDNPALILATTATATVWPTATANQFTLTVYNDANCSFETSHTVTILPPPEAVKTTVSPEQIGLLSAVMFGTGTGKIVTVWDVSNDGHVRS
jgi:hypothetical protein